jgi:beta-aspartyl-peptidase (threonine type)
MKQLFFLMCAAFLLYACTQQSDTETKGEAPFAIAIHGGAGAMPEGTYTAEEEKAYQLVLKEAAALGYEMLARGDSATHVVEAVIKILEDSPLFNAGKGSVITDNGQIRMDASIMDGKTLDAGAVTNVMHIKNPISAARAVMDHSKYILFSGTDADDFGRSMGLEMMEASYFYTPHQIERWIGSKDSAGYDNPFIDSLKNAMHDLESKHMAEKKYGTVGCVVKDKYSNLAAGTSTGGLFGKKFGRIGDSPIIGAGTYANNTTCAISCTGTGEDFIKTVAAKTVSDLMEFKGMTLEEATYELIHGIFPEINGDGGLIAVDKEGNISFQFNSDGMFRAWADAEGTVYTGIYKD